MSSTPDFRFSTRADVGHYFASKSIKCLLCGKRFGRLASHLAYKHNTNAAEYKRRFALPWTRGLTSGASHRKSGWNAKRRAHASRLAQRTRFFRFAKSGRDRRRESPTYIKSAWRRNLGKYADGFGKSFDRRVRALFDKGHIDREIAQTLRVNRMTVNRRTRTWRRRKEKRFQKRQSRSRP
jgi:ROS/MUCR transcriptional regulator protein